MFNNYRTLTRNYDYKDLDEQFLRICSNYGSSKYFHQEAILTCSDAISMAILCHFSKERKVYSFYKKCLKSLLRGLNLSFPKLIFDGLKDPLPGKIDLFAMRNPLKIRAYLIGFGDEFGNTVIGNPWLIFYEEKPDRYQHRNYVTSILALKNWYLQASDRLAAEGIPVIDKAICDILGWDFDKSIRFEKLRGYPDVDKAFCKYFCP